MQRLHHDNDTTTVANLRRVIISDRVIRKALGAAIIDTITSKWTGFLGRRNLGLVSEFEMKLALA